MKPQRARLAVALLFGLSAWLLPLKISEGKGVFRHGAAGAGPAGLSPDGVGPADRRVAQLVIAMP